MPPRRAEKVLTRLQAQVDEQRVTESSISLGRAIDEWLAANEIEDTTRRTYVGYIERTIKPAIGTEPIDKVNPRVALPQTAALPHAVQPSPVHRKAPGDWRTRLPPTRRLQRKQPACWTPRLRWTRTGPRWFG